MGYSLQVNVKTLEGTQHEDRDEQFRYINRQVSKFMRIWLPGRITLRSNELQDKTCTFPWILA
jgi:hypothetical protein